MKSVQSMGRKGWGAHMKSAIDKIGGSFLSLWPISRLRDEKDKRAGKAGETACPAVPMGAAMLGMSHALGISLPGPVGIAAAGCLVLAAALVAYLMRRFQKEKVLLNQLFEQSPLAVALTNLEHRIIRVNKGFTQVFGYTPEAAIGRRISELIVPPESQEEYRGHADAVARGERVDAEGVRVRQDGSRFPAAITYVPLSLPGHEAALYAIYRDITEQRRAEEARTTSEGRFRAIFDNAAVGITVMDLHGKFIAANRAYQEMLGYSEEEIRSMTHLDLTYEEDRPASAAVAADNWAGRLPQFQLEKRDRRKDGRIIWVRVTVSKTSGSGATPEIGIAIVEDITERKRAENRLLEYKKVVEGLQEMIVVLDREYRYVVTNQAFLNYHGLTREQVVGHFVPEFVGQERFNQVTKSNVDECFRGRVVTCEMEFTFPNLGRRDLLGSYYPIEGPEGVDRIAVVLEDVTERKRAEAARTASERRWRAIFDNSAVGIGLADMYGKITAANRAFQEMVGYSEEELQAMTYMDLTYEEDRSMNATLAAEMWADRLPGFPMEKRYRHKNGPPIWVKATVSKSPGDGTMPPFGIAIVEDITERKRADARLLEYEKVVEGLQEMIVVVDREYRYLIANRAFLEYRGLQLEHLVRHPVPGIIGQEIFEQVVKSKLDECFQGRVVRYELEFMHSKLGRRDLFATYFPIEGPTGIDRVAAVLEDITERKRAERKLQRSLLELQALNSQLQSVREEERTRLAREIHDQLGQSLTAIKIGLFALKTVPGRAQQSQSIEVILSLVDETIRSVRRISTELRPGILDHLGLVAAVEWAAEEFGERTGIQCQVSLPETNPAIDAARATALFRILQETLTNIARHAGATQVRIVLSLEGGHLALEVRDNGRGIGGDQLSGSESLGILGMRERALLLGGEFTIAGAPGMGTTVRVRIACADSRPAAAGQ